MTTDTRFAHITDALKWALDQIKEYQEDEVIEELPERYGAAEAMLDESLLECRIEHAREEEAAELMQTMSNLEWLQVRREGSTVVFRGTMGALAVFNLKPGTMKAK